MNRTLIIVAGIVLIVIVVGLWGYLLFFGGAEQAEDRFAEFGQNNEQTGAVREVDVQNTRQNAVPVAGTLLQIVARPIAGFMIIGNKIVYIERGTGHVYSSELFTGNELQLSRTTVRGIDSGVISPDSLHVVLSSVNDGGYLQSQLALIEDSELSFIEDVLFLGAREIQFMDNVTVRYVRDTESQTLGHSYNIETREKADLFVLPIPHMQVVWSEAALNEAIVFTPPSHNLEGYAYTVKDGVLTPLGAPAKGLLAFGDSDRTIRSYVDGSGMYQSISLIENEVVSGIGLTLIPDKCAFSGVSSSTLYCAAQYQARESEMVEEWYKGVYVADDTLWEIDLNSGASTLLNDPYESRQKIFDVGNLAAAADGSFVIIIDKEDDTLWMYRKN